MKKLVSLAIVLFFLVSTAAFADNGVNVSLEVGREEITVGDVVPLTVSVNHPKGWRVILPTLDEKWGELEVREQHAPQIIENADGSETTTQEIEVTYFRPEQVMTPALEISVVDAEGNVMPATVAPTAFTVNSVLKENDTELRDIKPQAELWQLSSSPIPMVASLALAFTLVGGASWWMLKNRPQSDKRTPRQRALDELKEAETEKLATTDAKQYGVRVSTALREYLTTGCNINARDLTTGELAQEMKVNQVPANVATQIIQVLRTCDGMKFANEMPEPEALNSLAAITQQIVLMYPAAAQNSREVKK
jgi:hypothetical protein